MEVWAKQCRAENCHNYIPDNWELCDFHLRERYGLLGEAVTDNSYFDRLYPEDIVLEALRKALQPWQRFFEEHNMPWVTDDYGRTDCFFCVNDYPNHRSDCIYTAAAELLGLELITKVGL